MATMTQEEKATRYDQAIKVAKSKIKYDKDHVLYENDVIEMFPELKESDDEKLRKRLIQIFKSYQNPKTHINPNKWEGLKICDIIDWFEKQGKVEPKFKVGDWITNGKCTWKIDSIDEDMYYNNHCGIDCGGDIKSIDEEYHLWTIQDAKDGDVLVCEDFGYTSLMLFESFFNGRTSLHCWYNSHTNNFHINTDVALRKDANIHLATKEQRDLLFQKIKEAGYEWDAVKKELKKIEQKQWKPSEEQIYALRSVVTELKHSDNKYQETIEDLYQDLKKLREK